MRDTKSQPDAASIKAGSKIGPYRVERRIGGGGMADVFYAIHEELQRPAAIKVLKQALAEEETNLQRFMQEARAAASLVHPNIVQVFDVGRDRDLRYIAQEYVAGTNLRQYLAQQKPAEQSATEREPQSAEGTATGEEPQDQPLGIAETLSILLQVLAALSKSASSGIVHRDIKPENIMLTKDGEVKVADFGLARTLFGDDPKLTRVGTTLGTPMYMSPEQIQDGKVDVRSDLYSLGVTLFHMLSGRPPFAGETPLALAMQHVQAPVPDLAAIRSDIPNSLIELVKRLLAKNPADRFDGPTEALSFLKERRMQDLAEVWPDQAVPLPGANSPVDPKLMQATLQLQQILRPAKRSFSRRLVGWTGAAIVILASLYAGTASSFSLPFQLFDRSKPPDVYKGVPKQESAAQQYRFALVTEQSTFSRVDKWAAVGYYFPKEQNEVNRAWVGMANIQCSRALRRKGDIEDAREMLVTLIRDPQMSDLYRAHAHLELAILEDEIASEGSEEKIKNEIEEALGIFRKLRPVDQEQLNALVKSMPRVISKPWFDEQSYADEPRG